MEQIDDRHDDEARINALGIVAGRVFHCTYIWRGEHRRIISLRKATRQEANDYFQITQSDR